MVHGSLGQWEDFIYKFYGLHEIFQGKLADEHIVVVFPIHWDVHSSVFK